MVGDDLDAIEAVWRHGSGEIGDETRPHRSKYCYIGIINECLQAMIIAEIGRVPTRMVLI